MYGLLTTGAATVLVGDGNWTAGYEVDALSCGRVIQGTDLCTPIAIAEPAESGTGYKIKPFGIEGHQKFRVVCSSDDADDALSAAIASASEYIVAKNFWNGDIADWPGSTEGMFLMDAGVSTVVAGANVGASIVAALAAAYTKHPEIEPIVHLGLGAAMNLTDNFFTKESNVPFVVSPGYPTDGVAVTGPIVVRLGSVETLKSYDHTINREYIQGTRLAAVEFDPCLAVRVA